VKRSRYNRIFEASDGTWLAFNSWSTALAELDPEDVPFIQAILADPDGVPCDSAHKREIREALIEGHFLLEDGDDELAALQVEMMRDRFRTDRLYLTIAPTLDCNFRCDYCYEEHFRVTMSRSVQEALLRWVEERSRRIELLHVTWFGGEPTLPGAMQVLENLSTRFQALAGEREFVYQAQLVTNGYLLDRRRMEKLAALAVKEVQITLDGPPAEHDRRRFLAGGQGTFERIVRNMKETVDLAQFQTRINVDRRNAGAALEVVELLAREGIAAKARPYLAQVTAAGTVCGNIQESCFSSEDFAHTEVEIYREAARRKLPLSRYPFRLTGAFCTADRAEAYVIAPSGAIFKCWHEVTLGPDLAIGHLVDGSQPFHRTNEAAWLAWTPMDKSECRSCSVLPLCHGGCPYEALKLKDEPHGACEHYKFHLEPILEIRHVARIPAAGASERRRGGVGGDPA